MALTDLMPWGRARSLAMPRFGAEGDPLFALQRDMNRILDDFARGFGMAPAAGFGGSGAWPRVEVSETDKDVTVVAELPGLEQNDIDVSLHDGVLTLKGEKKAERSNAFYSERWNGRFERSLQVGADVDPEQVSASFRNGMLTITLTKRADPQRPVRRIPISNG